MTNQIIQLNNGLGELDEREINLIKRIRTKYRFGKVTLETKDGLPLRIEKTVVYDNLTIA